MHARAPTIPPKKSWPFELGIANMRSKDARTSAGRTGLPVEYLMPRRITKR